MEFNGTFLATIFSFLVFVYLMNKVLYEPMRKIVSERKAFVEGNYSIAFDNNKKAEELSAQRDEKILKTKEEARLKYNTVLSDFKLKRAEALQEAQKEASGEIDSAFANLENVSNDAKQSLKGSMTDLANDIVEKVLGYRSDIQGFDDNKIDQILYNKES